LALLILEIVLLVEIGAVGGSSEGDQG